MFQCNDIEATKDWYSSILGCRCIGQMESGWLLERDGVAIMFMRNDHLGAPTATAAQYMYVDDVLGLWNSLGSVQR
jgi:catechol 2,3-dioxygenase-like lactoylglutathione lyase family enzyme